MNRNRRQTGAHVRYGIFCAAMLGGALLARGQFLSLASAPGNVTRSAPRRVQHSRSIVSDSAVPVAQAGIVANGGPCPCTIWDASAAPANPNGDDGQPIEVGVKFRSDVDGFITGLRFYKGSNNVGPHVGHLWTSAGSQLAQATFEGESASGWQEVTFSSPVAITAGTTYVASYHSTGGYAFDRSYLAAEHLNAPLRALADGSDGGNGVYHHGTSAFPTDAIQSTNFWVDVVFETTVTPDTTPPSITTTSPPNSASNVAVTAPVVANFSETLSNATISSATVNLRDSANRLSTGTITYDNVARSVTMRPSPPLLYSTTYTAKIAGGPGGVADTAGNPLPTDFSWTFTTATAPAPPPNDGPGGPILILSTSSNPFSRYYTEILRAEGLNEFTATDLSNLTPALLSGYDVVILGECALSDPQETMLANWVNGGGNLIAMRPDKKLAALLGLTDAGSTLADAYLGVNTSVEPGSGIVSQTMQFHGIADRYTLSGATAVATLFSTATSATASPAVTLRTVGGSGGQAAAFTYDLARSVVYTRQGNPLWAGQDRDGSGPIRSDDLFYAAKTGDVQPDWLDFSRVQIPQADEQQRLLANLIQLMNRDRKPLPHFWYLPRGLKAAVVMTGDDHASGGTSGQFDKLIAASPTGCSMANWECLRSTSFIYTSTPLSDSAAAAYEAQGFDVADHVTTFCADWTSQSSLSARFDADISAWKAKYASLPFPVSNRTHCMVWSDWGSQPKVELAHGIRFDTTYYYFPSIFVQDRPGLFTGSGMPMRYADIDGSIVDVYQAATDITDESGMTISNHIVTLLDNALGASGYYGVFTVNMHTDLSDHPGANTIVAAAQARSVPVVSARQMLAWLDGRNASAFANVSWSSNALSFSVNPGATANGLQTLLPTLSSAGTLSGITRSGLNVVYSTEIIKGIEYARFDSPAGSYVAAYGPVAAPTTTNLSSGPNPSTLNQTITFTATVSPSLATGIVEFRDSSTVIGTAPLTSGSATLTTSALSAGAHSIVATYPGDSSYATSASNPLAQQVAAPSHVISAVTPDNSCQNGPPLTITAGGSGFINGSSVLWNGSSRTTRFLSGGQLEADVNAADLALPGSTAIAVVDPFGNVSASSVSFSVNPDVTGPAVTPPAAITVAQTLCSAGSAGTTGSSDAAVATFLAAGSSSDECSGTAHLPAQLSGADVGNSTFFPAGVSSVTFRFEDASHNVGSSPSSITVQAYGDLNSDFVADSTDLVILSNYVVHNLAAGTPPFTAPLALVDLNGDGFVDSLDLVLLSNYAVHNIGCLPQH